MPRFVGRLLTGEVGDVMMTELRGASNAKAKRELGWTPSHSSWREGFVGLAVMTPGGRRRMPPDDARHDGSSADVNDREALLDELRPTSFAIAYRMLGSVSEAEDVVQEALLRVHQSLDAR